MVRGAARAERRRLVVDNSTLSELAKCDTAAFLQYACDLRTREESLALGSGSSIHLGLQRKLEGASDAEAIRIMAEDYENRVERYLRLIERGQLGKDDLRFAPEWVEAIFAQYLERYRDRWPYKLVKATAEKPIWAPFPVEVASGKEVIYVARLDAIVRKWESGGKWLLDHKVTRKVSEWWIAKQKVSSQFTGQLWLAREQGIIAGAEGVLLNAIELGEPHRSEKVCPLHKVSYQKCSVRHNGGQFIYVTRHDAEMEAWKHTAAKLIKRWDRLVTLAEEEGIQAIEQVQMQGRFNQGCVFCSNKDWCRLGRNVSKAAIRAMFLEEKWDPLAA
jgi:hypothetical protein